MEVDTLMLLLVAGLFFGHLILATRSISVRVDAIVGELKSMASQDQRREVALERVISKFEESVSDGKRMADSCEKLAQMACETAERAKESAAAVVQISLTHKKEIEIVDKLAQAVMAAEARLRCPEIQKGPQ